MRWSKVWTWLFLRLVGFGYNGEAAPLAPEHLRTKVLRPDWCPVYCILFPLDRSRFINCLSVPCQVKCLARPFSMLHGRSLILPQTSQLLCLTVSSKLSLLGLTITFLAMPSFFLKKLVWPSSMLHGPINFLDPAPNVPTTLLDRVFKTFVARLDHIFLDHTKSLKKTKLDPSQCCMVPLI